MLIRKLDPEQFVDAYNAKEQMFYPWSEVPPTPFGSGWLVVAPGQATKPHNHHEGETFIILRGRGLMMVGREQREVEPGDVIYLPAFGDHTLENTSDHEDLHFLSIWWEDPKTVAGLQDEAADAGAPPRAELLITAGGGGGAAAAIHARFAGLRGRRLRTLASLDGEPAASDVPALALYERLRAAGETTLATRPALYCEACGAHRAAGEVIGTCAACGHRATGGGCGACGESAGGGEALAGAVCARCASPLVRRPLTRLFWSAGRHLAAVRRQQSATAMSARLRGLVDAALERGLEEVALSEAAGSGPGPAMPLPDLAGQRFAPWFARAARLLESVADATPADEQQVVFVDPDEASTYAVLLPALAAAAGATAWAPAALVDGALVDGDRHGAGLEARTEELIAAAQPWLVQLDEKLADDHGGKAPPTQAWTPEQRRFAGLIVRASADAAQAFEAATFAPRRAARALADLIAAAGEFAALEQPWRRLAGRREERNTGVALELWAVRVLALAAYPLAPAWSSRLWRCLGSAAELAGGETGTAGDGAAADGAGAWEDPPALVPSGQPVQAFADLVAAPSGGDSAPVPALAAQPPVQAPAGRSQPSA
jgi:methionyl-tRNA synthetase